MNKPLIDWEQIEKERYIKDYFSEKEIEFLNLNQGVFQNEFYFGKVILKENKKGKNVELPSLIFSNRKIVVNETEIEGKNGIREIGINYKNPLQFTEQCWTNTDIIKFINYENDETKTKDLFELIKKQIEKYMDVYDSAIFDVCALYVMHSYLFTLFNSLGYLFFCSRRESGKTKLMNIIGYMAFNTQNTTNPSESAIFRICDAYKPTLKIDDYEKIDDDKQKYIDQILKTGYKKGGCVVRVDRIKDQFKITKFDTFCPKMLTNTTGLDEITMTRCITIKLIKTKTAKGNLEPNENDEIWREIRAKCYYWALENWESVLESYSNYENPMFKNREMEILKAILSISKIIGEDIENKVSKFLRLSIDDRDVSDSDDWEQIFLYEIIKRGENEANIMLGVEWYSLRELLSLCSDVIAFGYSEENAESKTLHFKTENKAKVWMGKTLTKLPLNVVKKRRSNKGVEYFFNLEELKEYYNRTYGVSDKN